MHDLIHRARSGDQQARGQLLEVMRPRLREWADDALNARFTGRFDASDLTQITLLDVHQKLEQFVGSTEGELLDWLRRGLERNILDAVRRATAQKRTVAREQRIDVATPGQGLPRNELKGDHSTPSMQAMRNEDAERLEQALGQLLPDQQLVIRLVHLQGQSLGRAAEELNRTPAAVAKLLQRGIKKKESPRPTRLRVPIAIIDREAELTASGLILSAFDGCQRTEVHRLQLLVGKFQVTRAESIAWLPGLHRSARALPTIRSVASIAIGTAIPAGILSVSDGRRDLLGVPGLLLDMRHHLLMGRVGLSRLKPRRRVGLCRVRQLQCEQAEGGNPKGLRQGAEHHETPGIEGRKLVLSEEAQSANVQDGL
jgi:RNA polymerase sigma-70 factor (ECF subfamily)